MSELRRELETLRRKLAEIDSKYAGPVTSAASPALAEASAFLSHDVDEALATQAALEDWLGSEPVDTAYGRHLERETFYPSAKPHGSADIGALSEMPPDLLDAISEGCAPQSPPSDWAFLDTETTGLSAGMDTCAFLVGIGRITPDGFRVRQFFMRSYEEEASLLDAVGRYLAPFRVLVTYNGRAFDQPLLESRFLLNNAPQPFDKLGHLDLLHGARRLWKLSFDNCRLVELERQVLGFEREGDVPSALIPYLYFDYLRTQQAARLLPVFHHNALDILSLACLTAIVPHVFRDLDRPDCGTGLRTGAEMVSLARWLRNTGDLERSRLLLRQAIDKGLQEQHLYPAMWDASLLERKLDDRAAAIRLWEELSTVPNPFRVKALIELAKHYEHQAKDLAQALETTRRAFDHPLSGQDAAALRHREQRLLRRTTIKNATHKPQLRP